MAIKCAVGENEKVRSFIEIFLSRWRCHYNTTTTTSISSFELSQPLMSYRIMQLGTFCMFCHNLWHQLIFTIPLSITVLVKGQRLLKICRRKKGNVIAHIICKHTRCISMLNVCCEHYRFHCARSVRIYLWVTHEYFFLFSSLSQCSSSRGIKDLRLAFFESKSEFCWVWFICKISFVVAVPNVLSWDVFVA
jgi:hypothetical protein